GSLAALVGESLPLIELARVMITESENNATNIVLEQLGGLDGANRWLNDHGYTHTRWGRRMLDFAARAAGHDNTTSAREMAAVLHQLATQSPTMPHLAPLYEWLTTAVCSEKLELGLPIGTPLAHKVGDLPDVEHDAGIITLPNGDWYVLVVLAADIRDGGSARATIAEISRLCWETMQ
ncbi:MAG: class A beta-lactamase-related serine hydrolase, partial [Chloroflexota bacterium]|nr:class A beta-lactamase-related serine hydrolase [Chloroflexota bacterium]